MADAPGRPAEALLARLGMAGGSAVRALTAVGLWGDDGPRPEAWPVVEAVSISPDPGLALVGVTRLAERDPEGFAAVVASGTGLRRLARVTAVSEALATVLAASRDALEVLLGDLAPLTAEAARAACRAALEPGEDPANQAAALTRLQRLGLVRIATRDLTGLADTPMVSNELADLAEGLLAGALDVVLAEQDDPGDARLALVGMGKLGGRELNYVSDVDVIFVADSDWATAARLTERFLRLLGTVTPEGRAYEVDTNLRPEGRDGSLVRSLDAYAAYYERWARPWEFQALLKARPLGGDVDLGSRFAERVEPYLWPDRLEGRVVEEIQRLKSVVEGSRDVRRAGGRQVKLGPGGLRDIEFTVQLLQLVHGRHDRSLRSPNTLAALAALAAGGYVDDGDANLFGDAYQFLRTVEHRLQLRRLRRTHTVPEQPGARERLARAMGFRTLRTATALAQFDREYARVRGYVRRLHEQLFYRPLLARFGELTSTEQMAVGGDHRLAEDAARERLAALGFADPNGALRHLDALASGVSRRAQLFRTLLPALLPTLAAAPDPDGGLAAFRSLADRLGDSSSFLRTLRDATPVGELLIRVLGASRLVGEWLERQPEVLTSLADLGALARGLGPDDYRRLADGLVRRGGDLDQASDALRRLRRREAARIAVRDLSAQADVAEVGAELTGVAEACLEAAVGLTVPEGVRFAVIGMGKLGGRELAYASDLDVLLVFEPADAREDALRAAEALLRLLSAITPEGQAFRIDANLRPEGKDGPLARTLDSYRAYYQRWAEAWELQALTQARPVAGDEALGAAFVDAVTDLVYPEQPPAERLAEVRQMKARVERDRAGGGRRPAPTTWGAAQRGRARDRADIKHGPGGLSDIEWTVQLLQLAFGGRIPELRVAGTGAALAVCEQEGVLDGGEALWLRDGHRLQSRVRNAAYLAGLRETDRLPASPDDVERLARMLGYPAPAGQSFSEDLARVRRRVRKVHERRFYAS